MHVWQKSARNTASLERWLERLSRAVDRQRIAVVALTGRGSSRLEVYCAGETEARSLADRFGGRVREVRDESWQPPPATARGRPLPAGGRLLVTARPEELAVLRAAHPRKRVLCIPAAMAFGTGEHATTAMCLRLLVEASRRRASDAWEMLDLGTGSGILALAANLLGARRALGIDNDADAVRTARENGRLNAIPPRFVRFIRADICNWRLPVERKWPVITANLFSELHVHLLPGVIARLASGDVILSGILSSQERDVLDAARGAGF